MLYYQIGSKITAAYCIHKFGNFYETILRLKSLTFVEYGYTYQFIDHALNPKLEPHSGKLLLYNELLGSLVGTKLVDFYYNNPYLKMSFSNKKHLVWDQFGVDENNLAKFVSLYTPKDLNRLYDLC